MKKQIILIAAFLLSLTSVAWADGPVRAYGQQPTFSEDEQDGLVNADGVLEDPQAPMSTTARAYRNGLIGGKHLQKAEDDARAAQAQAQQLQQNYGTVQQAARAPQPQPQQYYPANPQARYYAAPPQPQYAQPQYDEPQYAEDDSPAQVYVVPDVVRTNAYPPTRGLNDYQRPQETCYYNSCSGYSRSVQQPNYYQPAPPPAVYVAPRVVLPQRFGYDPRYGQYPLANGYRTYVPARPQPYPPRDVYYTRGY